MSSGDSKKVVVAALLGNLAIAACKFAAAFATGSTATLAEAVHSVADTGNQVLLLIGLTLAMRPPDEKFPFGRSSEKYFWPFVVAVMLFSVGGAFGIYEGVTHILHPEAPSGSRIWSYAVLGASLAFEALSFRVAWGEFQVARRGRSYRASLLETRDPTIPLVLAEDTAALVGLALAFGAVLMSDITGQHFWDPLGSIVIGLLLCGLAVLLARVTHSLLIGTSAEPEEEGRVLAIVETTPGVERVTQILTMHLGPDVVLLALKLAFRPQMPVEELEAVTNEVERRLRAEMPHMRKIFVEADSQGDGRGIARANRGRSVQASGLTAGLVE